METDVVRYIALCGYPKAGKTEVQRIISRRYGFTAYDDSAPLREATKALYGLTDWHVTTQAGKATVLDIAGMNITVRQAMGELGCYLEEHDEFHFPRLAVKTCQQSHSDGKFVFASVRQNQPAFFKEIGQSLVIEVTRQGCVASGDFDEYFRDPIDISIENHRDEVDPERSLASLEARVAEALDPILLPVSVSA
jgi:hypothetical protein